MANEHFTEDEIEALSLLEKLDAVLDRIVDAGGDGGAGIADSLRMGGHVSALRNAVLAQGAIRLYPGVARPLGGQVPRCTSKLWENGQEAGRCELVEGHEGEHDFGGGR